MDRQLTRFRRAWQEAPDDVGSFIHYLSQTSRLYGIIQSDEIVAVRDALSEIDPEGGQKYLPHGINEFGRIELIHRMSSMIFVVIPSGSFMMGDTDGDDDEAPVHRVAIEKPQLCAKYPITQRQWRTIMGNNPSTFSNEKGTPKKTTERQGHSGVPGLTTIEDDTEDWDDHPVETVSWLDCQVFMKKTGLRLPPEAGWEYACRAGTTERFHAAAHDDPTKGGSDEDHLAKIAVFGRSYDEGHAPVGSKQPNSWGIYDMLGNVWEWCQDEYHNDYRGAPVDCRPWNTDWEDLRDKLLEEATDRGLITQDEIDELMDIGDDAEDSNVRADLVEKYTSVMLNLIAEKKLEPWRSDPTSAGASSPSLPGDGSGITPTQSHLHDGVSSAIIGDAESVPGGDDTAPLGSRAPHTDSGATPDSTRDSTTLMIRHSTPMESGHGGDADPTQRPSEARGASATVPGTDSPSIPTSGQCGPPERAEESGAGEAENSRPLSGRFPGMNTTISSRGTDTGAMRSGPPSTVNGSEQERGVVPDPFVGRAGESSPSSVGGTSCEETGTSPDGTTHSARRTPSSDTPSGAESIAQSSSMASEHGDEIVGSFMEESNRAEGETPVEVGPFSDTSRPSSDTPLTQEISEISSSVSSPCPDPSEASTTSTPHDETGISTGGQVHGIPLVSPVCASETGAFVQAAESGAGVEVHDPLAQTPSSGSSNQPTNQEASSTPTSLSSGTTNSSEAGSHTHEEARLHAQEMPREAQPTAPGPAQSDADGNPSVAGGSPRPFVLMSDSDSDMTGPKSSTGEIGSPSPSTVTTTSEQELGEDEQRPDPPPDSSIPARSTRHTSPSTFHPSLILDVFDDATRSTWSTPITSPRSSSNPPPEESCAEDCAAESPAWHNLRSVSGLGGDLPFGPSVVGNSESAPGDENVRVDVFQPRHLRWSVSSRAILRAAIVSDLDIMIRRKGLIGFDDSGSVWAAKFVLDSVVGVRCFG